MSTPYVLSGKNIEEAVNFRNSPFRYFLAKRFLAPDVEQATLEWFESGAPWCLAETDFYEQYEFSMLDAQLPKQIRSLTSPLSLLQIRNAMETIFDTSLSNSVTLLAHKLVPGQRIAIHNDYLGGNETHRLTIQLNRGLSYDDGGLLLLFNSFNPNDIHRILRPVCGSGIGFEIGCNSNHAVSRLHRGERYTLVYSFFASHLAKPDIRTI